MRVSETRKNAKSNVGKVSKSKATNAILSVSAPLCGSVLSDVAWYDAILCGKTRAGVIQCDEMRADAIPCGEGCADAILCDKTRADAILCGKTRVDAILSGKSSADAILSGETLVDAILCDGSRCDAILGAGWVKSDAILGATSIMRSDAIHCDVVRSMNSESP